MQRLLHPSHSFRPGLSGSIRHALTPEIQSLTRNITMDVGINYNVTMVVADPSWVDLDMGYASELRQYLIRQWNGYGVG